VTNKTNDKIIGLLTSRKHGAEKKEFTLKICENLTKNMIKQLK
jgi:hypothetical protein